MRSARSLTFLPAPASSRRINSATALRGRMKLASEAPLALISSITMRCPSVATRVRPLSLKSKKAPARLTRWVMVEIADSMRLSVVASSALASSASKSAFLATASLGNCLPSRRLRAYLVRPTPRRTAFFSTLKEMSSLAGLYWTMLLSLAALTAIAAASLASPLSLQLVAISSCPSEPVKRSSSPSTSSSRLPRISCSGLLSTTLPTRPRASRKAPLATLNILFLAPNQQGILLYFRLGLMSNYYHGLCFSAQPREGPQPPAGALCKALSTALALPVDWRAPRRCRQPCRQAIHRGDRG